MYISSVNQPVLDKTEFMVKKNKEIKKDIKISKKLKEVKSP